MIFLSQRVEKHVIRIEKLRGLCFRFVFDCLSQKDNHVDHHLLAIVPQKGSHIDHHLLAIVLLVRFRLFIFDWLSGYRLDVRLCSPAHV